MKLIIHKITVGLLAFICLGFLWVIFEMVRPYNIATLNSLTVPPIVYRGVETSYVADACKYMAIPAELAVAIQDGNVFQLFTQTTSLSVGCHVSIRPFTAPEFLHPGIYRIHWTAVYHPNIFRTVILDAYSNDFELK